METIFLLVSKHLILLESQLTSSSLLPPGQSFAVLARTVLPASSPDRELDTGQPMRTGRYENASKI